MAYLRDDPTTRRDSRNAAKLTDSFIIEFSGRVAALNHRHLLLIALLCLHFKCGESVLVQRPTDAIVLANHSTFFNCSKSVDKSRNNSEELTWYHQPLGVVPTGVYEDGRIRDKYKDRFSIDKNVASGIFNLLAQRPESKDSGKYKCVDNVLEDTGASAELIVLESNLVCESNNDLDEIIGSTECAQPIVHDQLQLTCSVTYSGTFPPQMKWRKVDSELQPNETRCDTRGSRVMCNLTLEANRNMDASVYICEMITAEQYNCSLKVNKPIYAFANTTKMEFHTGDEVTCVANASKQLPCSYKWYNYSSLTVASYHEKIQPNDPGLYTCQAHCQIRNDSCKFTAMVISVSAVDAPDTGLSKSSVALIVVFVILTVCAVIIILVFLVRKRSQNNDITHAAQKDPLLTNPISTEMELKDIPKSRSQMKFINKGDSGDFYGPFDFQAIKCVSQLILQDPSTEVTEDEVCKLGKHWMELDHKNVLKFRGVFFQPPGLYIVMDYADGGTVRRVLDTCTEDLKISVVKGWATQIANGMNYLHGMTRVHGRLKSAQILLMKPFDPTDPEPTTVKIASYRLTKSNGHSAEVTFKGMFAWMAPETIKGEATSQASDVWSYGVTVWEMLTKEIPYKGVKQVLLIKEISEGTRTLSDSVPSRCPDVIRDILKECWLYDKDKRPTFSDVVSSLEAIPDS